MTETSPALSISDIEKKIEERRSQIQQLFQKREKLQAVFDQIDSEMQSLANVDGRSARRRGGRRRSQNETLLRPLVLQILGKNKKGLSLSDLADKVLETGYKSGSRHFKNVVYQCVYNTDQVEHDADRGVYKLKK